MGSRSSYIEKANVVNITCLHSRPLTGRSSTTKKKPKQCLGYGGIQGKCTNYAISKKEDYCQKCYEKEFHDTILELYKAQNYYILSTEDGLFTVELKYGASKYVDIIIPIVKFEGEINILDIQNAKRLGMGRLGQVTIITNIESTNDIKQYAKDSNIRIITKQELINSLFDLTNYLANLIKNAKTEQLDNHYIDVYGTKMWGETSENDLENDDDEFSEEFEINSKNKMLLSKYVDKFLDSDYQALLILGDYGSGKTSFSYTYALRLLQNFIEMKSLYLPILVKLRSYYKAISINQLLTDYFVNELAINNFNIGSLNLLMRNLPIVFIFDGFDEVAKKVDYDIKHEVFKEICKFALDRTKIIVTCRPNYFQDESEFKRVFSDSHYPYEPGENTSIEFISNSIMDLDERQIKKYLHTFDEEMKKTGVTLKDILDTIAKTHDLRDLAKRPFLLYLIIKTLPSLISKYKKNKSVNMRAADLYAEYTDNWLSREDRKNKTLIKRSDKELFCKEFAFELYKNNATGLHYKEFPKVIKNHFRHLERIEDIDYFCHDIQSCSFLNTDGSGEFRFIHKSFMEYFVAETVVQKMSQLTINTESQKAIDIINNALGVNYMSMEICLFINDGVIPSATVWYKVMKDNFVFGNEIAKANCLSIIAKTGENIAEYLQLSSIRLSSVELSHANINGIKLQSISLSEASLYSVNIKDVTFYKCSFSGAIFGKCILHNIHFINCRMENCNWSETEITSCTFKECNLIANEFSYSSIINCKFSEGDFSCTVIGPEVTMSGNTYKDDIIGLPYEMK